ncbi:MAG TPA: hypothetical protein VI479_07350 [Blastocatellia bacterium]
MTARNVPQIGYASPLKTATQTAPVKPAKPKAKAPFVTSHGRARKPRASKTKKPTASSGYFFRKNGAGWDLRRDTYVTSHDGEKKRKQPYVAHMSQEAFRELKRQHRGAALEKAIAQWIADHDKS